MQRFSSSSMTLALGLAPPREEPGEIKSFRSSSCSSFSQNRLLASKSFFMSTKGGMDLISLSKLNLLHPNSFSLIAPCLEKSLTNSTFPV